MTRWSPWLAFAGAALILLPRPAQAHNLRLGIFAVDELGAETYRVRWTVALPGGETPHGHRSPELPQTCKVSDTSRSQESGAQTWSATARCSGGLSGTTLRVAPDLPILLHWRPAHGAPVSKLLRDHGGTLALPGDSQAVGDAASYVRLGAEHIAEGFDHLLFVLGLLLLIPTLGRLALAVTSFTLGHSVSLALATLGTASLPSGPVETLIAMSVVLLAVEVSRAPDTAATLTRRYPQWAAASFGLIHGLGFAGALEETGLPEEGVGWALAGFNVGVELGQLAFVLVMAGLLTWVGKRVEERHLRRVLAYGMGTLATYWTLDRITGWL